MERLIDRAGVAVLGHRGVRGAAPENTIAAFELAEAQGADGVELDVRRSRDGVLIVHHDAIRDGAVLGDLAWDEIHERWPSIPTFAAALDACTGLLVNVEVKNSPRDPDFDPGEDVATEVAAILAGRGLSASTVVSSFHPPTVDRVAAAEPGLRTGQLLLPEADPLGAVDDIADRGHHAINPWVGSVAGAAADNLVAAAHAAGLWVMVWTVNDPSDLRRLAAAGVDALIVDDPQAARAAL